MWVSASLWASRPLYGPWTSPTHSLLPNGLFTSSMHHPWVSRTPSMGTMCQPRTHIHENPARLCPWEPRTTPLFSTISNKSLLGFSFLSFFSRIFVCGPFRLSLSPLGRDHEHITTFAAYHHGLWYHCLGAYFRPYKLFLSLQTRLSCPWTTNPSGWIM